ncbi:precorrin-2 dehydrogenase/sirohydrochlorin ferrochelatase family protein [Salinibaculum rarum]|uniref:precorrin-2 dehydrogenase/sirohydrochlorin ferrochelatase family protein n=1 Tax=Salinibaculum rarum TaxID=3058903 RepID=UPI00265F0FE0|nr:bifunctional precorrin-2 dehydrogenase/sirohydrochlorin ferrochelatase [Salinibaculum sp. KK48]
MIPLLHDFEGETVLVFGGGSVGARKARHFAREAAVIVVSPSFSAADFGGAELIRADPDADAVAAWVARTDPALVVAATDDETVNDAVETAASDQNILCNRADQSGPRDPGSVVVPATVRDGPVVVSVATGGRSPALSRALRERIEPLVENAGAMADLTADLRSDLKERLPAGERRAVLREVVRDDAVWKGLDSGSSNIDQRVTDVISDVTGDCP